MENKTDKDFLLTSGQAAQICGVATRTFVKWFDLGMVRGSRLPLKSNSNGDRRVLYSELVRFCREKGILYQGFPSSKKAVLYHSPTKFIRDKLDSDPVEGVEMFYVENDVEYGAWLANKTPDLIIIDQTNVNPYILKKLPAITSKMLDSYITVTKFLLVLDESRNKSKDVVKEYFECGYNDIITFNNIGLITKEISEGINKPRVVERFPRKGKSL